MAGKKENPNYRNPFSKANQRRIFAGFVNSTADSHSGIKKLQDSFSYYAKSVKSAKPAKSRPAKSK